MVQALNPLAHDNRFGYSAVEWQTIKFTPLWVFSTVAEADGKVSDKEWDAFTNWISNAFGRPGRLLRDVLHDIMDQGLASVFEEYMADPRTVHEGFRDARGLLARAPQDDVILYTGALTGLAVDVADTSKRLFGGIDRKAEFAFNYVVSALDVDPDAYLALVKARLGQPQPEPS